MRRGMAVALAVLCAAIVVGCGDDEKDTTSGGAAGTTAESTAGAKPTGEPIKIMTIAPLSIPQTGTKQPAEGQSSAARVEAINKAGGINGRPIEQILCDSQNDTNRELGCARQAIEKGVVAVVGCDCPYGDNSIPLLEKAGIPVLGTFAQGTVSVKSPVSFPFISGLPGLFAGMPRVLAQNGAKKIGYIHQDLGQATANTFKYVDLGIKAAGATSAGRIGVAPDVTDFAPSIAKAGDRGADALITFFVGDAAATFTRQAREQLPDMPLAVVGSSVTLSPKLIQALGSSAEGVYVVGAMPPADSDLPGAKQYRDDVAAATKSFEIDPNDGQVFAMWLTTWIFGEVAAKLPSDKITKESVLKAMGELENFETGGLTPPLTTTKPMADVPDAPRLFNPTAVLSVIKDGKTELLGKGFVNPFKGPTDEAGR
jgi:ABC-type branched-subunit amino acid transport system substrate-binding protein